MDSNGPRRIGVVIATDHFITRGVLRGILGYVAGNPAWNVVGGTTLARAADVFGRWPPDGVITMLETATDFGVPTVAAVHPRAGVPRVAMDDVAAGQLAAHHLQDRGFQRFAFVGHRGQWWSDSREAGFVAALRAAGRVTVPRFVAGQFRPGQWQSSSRRLATWLASLPKPVAVFASNDMRGRETIDAALTVGLRVPGDVAVLGVDNDNVECEMAHVPVSSIIYPAEAVGACAAATLARMLAGETVHPDSILIPPTGIQTRRSTDILAVQDAAVAAAYRFIRDDVGSLLGVQDVARHAGIARRTLEAKYRAALGRSVHDDIAATRLDLARELVVRTQLPLKEIAVRAGFGSAAYLSKVFRRELQTTPGTLRRSGGR